MYDVIVIGGGPGGYVSAIRGAQLGLKVAVVEKENLGGICLNWGCIPTKALLRSAEVTSLIKRAEEFGITIPEFSVSLPKMIERSRKVVDRLVKGVETLMKSNNITVIKGTAYFKSSFVLSVENNGESKAYQAQNYIIATGARARLLPNVKPSKRIWTYTEAMSPSLETPPKRLLVVGSGAIGIEFASFYHTLGSEITVVELLDRILPQEDHEISATAEKMFKHKGWTIHTKRSVQALDEKDDIVTATFDNGETAEFDAVLIAIGIVGNTEGLGLENTKIQVDRSHIVIDNFNRTAETHIYGIGDVVAPPWLAHKASHEGIFVMEHIKGMRTEPIIDKIPGCTYCNPQIASIGLSEDAARQKCKDIKVGRFNFAANGKAIAIGEAEGFIKTIFDAKTGELLGAHMIGPEVTELIHSLSLAMQLETTEAEIMHTIFPHPTLSEAIHESVLDAFQQVIHWPKS